MSSQVACLPKDSPGANENTQGQSQPRFKIIALEDPRLLRLSLQLLVMGLVCRAFHSAGNCPWAVLRSR